MKKRISVLLAVMLLVSALCTIGVPAMAVNTAVAPAVRVNGHIVTFPDAQPYIDNNGRTMIPVRVATEQLGATVLWDGKTNTATITKKDITVVIAVGDTKLKVTVAGKTTDVIMDTEAVLQDSRTYVPIRFVAEALGAYVDYSNVYNVVGIFSDELTAAQITKLRAYPYTQSDNAVSYETETSKKNAQDLAYYYGTDRDSFSGPSGYANAREHLFNCITRISTYPFKALDKVLKGGTNDEFFACVTQEAKAEISYFSNNISFEFIADGSCIYQENNVDTITAAVRGIIVMTCHVQPTTLSGDEMAMVSRYGFTQVQQGSVKYIPVDVHMNTQPKNNVNIKTIVPLDSQYN